MRAYPLFDETDYPTDADRNARIMFVVIWLGLTFLTIIANGLGLIKVSDYILGGMLAVGGLSPVLNFIQKGLEDRKINKDNFLKKKPDTKRLPKK